MGRQRTAAGSRSAPHAGYRTCNGAWKQRGSQYPGPQIRTTRVPTRCPPVAPHHPWRELPAPEGRWHHPGDERPLAVRIPYCGRCPGLCCRSGTIHCGRCGAKQSAACRHSPWVVSLPALRWPLRSAGEPHPRGRPRRVSLHVQKRFCVSRAHSTSPQPHRSTVSRPPTQFVACP